MHGMNGVHRRVRGDCGVAPKGDPLERLHVVGELSSGRCPPDSGTVLAVEPDAGDRFPAPPFTALVFEPNSIPKLGIDSEKLTVLDVDLDTFTIERSAGHDAPIPIRAGMQIAAQGKIPTYQLGETLHLQVSFDEGGTDPGSAYVRNSQGELFVYSDAEVIDDGVFVLDVLLDIGGLWRTEWISPSGVLAHERDLFVTFDHVDRFDP
jgi:hypothetical protein